jgi:hypothetical protein
MKEKQIISQYPLTKKHLVEARASSEFVEGVDWRRGEGKGPNSAVIWSPEAVQRLLTAKKIDVSLPTNVVHSNSGPEKPKEEPVSTKKTDIGTVPAIVKQKFPSKNVVRCEIRGESKLVYVKDSHFLRVGSIINAKMRGERYISDFKVDGMGRIHA